MDFPYSRHALNAVFRMAGEPAVQSMISKHLIGLLRAGLERREVQVVVDDDVFMEGMIEFAKNEELAAFMVKKDHEVVLRYVLKILETGPKKLLDMAVHFFLVLMSRIIVDHRARVFGAGPGASILNLLLASNMTSEGHMQLKAVKHALDSAAVVPTSAVPEPWYRQPAPTQSSASSMWDSVRSPVPLCALPSCVPLPLNNSEPEQFVQCGGCREVSYCSTSHQRLHYDLHKRVCSGKHLVDAQLPHSIVPVQFDPSEVL
jgi:hypothetical protein